jgi:phosphoglycerate dehydrogenase-like enzyme
MSSDNFRVGVTHDFLNSVGECTFGDIGLGLLEQDDRIEYEFLPPSDGELPASVGQDFDALLVLAPAVGDGTLSNAARLKLIARFGVGYDSVNVAACTSNGVMLTITPDGVRRPVAVSALTLILAITHKLLIKDRLTRNGGWDNKLDHMGVGPTGKTLGLVGLGNIGQEIVRMVSPLEMKCLAYDPYFPGDQAPAGVDLVDLETLMTTADVVCVCCALTAETRHLIDSTRIALMKSTAFLVNVARGPVVAQQALTLALQRGEIAGAALDVFEVEPIAADDPLLTLENVILSPHAICWTDELFRGNGYSACRSIVEVAHGRIPEYVVNRQVLENRPLQAKLAELRRD